MPPPLGLAFLFTRLRFARDLWRFTNMLWFGFILIIGRLLIQYCQPPKLKVEQKRFHSVFSEKKISAKWRISVRDVQFSVPTAELADSSNRPQWCNKIRTVSGLLVSSVSCDRRRCRQLYNRGHLGVSGRFFEYKRPQPHLTARCSRACLTSRSAHKQPRSNDGTR